MSIISILVLQRDEEDDALKAAAIWLACLQPVVVVAAIPATNGNLITLARRKKTNLAYGRPRAKSSRRPLLLHCSNICIN